MMMGSSVVTAANMFLKCSVILLACSFSDPAYGKGGITARLRLHVPWLENCVRQDCDISHSE